MTYLINNPLIGIMVVLLSGVVVFIGLKIYNEVVLNRLLKNKQGAMRIGDSNPGFKKRIGILGSTALAPAMVIALLLVTGPAARAIPTGELATIHDSNDVLNIYEAFTDKLQTSGGFLKFGLNQYEALEDAAPEFDVDNLVTSDGESPVYGYSGDERGSDDYSETNNQVIGVDEMDNVITDGKYIYTIQGSKVLITLAYTIGDETDALSNYKVLDFIEEDNEECPNGFYIQGMYVDNDYLVVIGNEQDYYCNEDGNETDIWFEDFWWGYYYQNDVKVYVFDKSDDYSLLDEYEVSGRLIGTRKIGDNLFIVTTEYLPFDQEDFTVDDHLPFYTNGETTTVAEYQDITYIEGIRPNAFTSFYAIDIDNKLVDVEVVLGDAGYNL